MLSLATTAPVAAVDTLPIESAALFARLLPSSSVSEVSPLSSRLSFTSEDAMSETLPKPDIGTGPANAEPEALPEYSGP